MGVLEVQSFHNSLSAGCVLVFLKACNIIENAPFNGLFSLLGQLDMPDPNGALYSNLRMNERAVW